MSPLNCNHLLFPLLFFLFLCISPLIHSASQTFWQDWSLSLVRRQGRRGTGRIPCALLDFCPNFLQLYNPFYQRNRPIPRLSSMGFFDPSTHKCCEICLVNVRLSDCHCCCRNGHFLHFECFAQLIQHSNPDLHRCPLCREALFTVPDRIRDVVMHCDPGEDGSVWRAVEGHIQVFTRIDPEILKNVNWKVALFYLGLNGSSAHLRSFIGLNLVSLNEPDNHSVFSVLLSKICRGGHDRCRDNFLVLLAHPEIDLNLSAGRHLIYRIIDSDFFDVFLLVLEVSPNLDLTHVFRYVCSLPSRVLFFNYLLTCKSFDLFAPDEFNCSALHIAVRKGNDCYALALLDLPEMSLNYLSTQDTRNGQTVIHVAMTSSLDDLIFKLLSFPGINWDLEDLSGRSIFSLYESRFEYS